MKIGILKEQEKHENRVAATPETIKKYINLGCEVFVETEAGKNSFYTDHNYEKAGATIKKSANEIVKEVDVLLSVQASSNLNNLSKGAYAVGMFNPFNNKSLFQELTKSDITAFSMELIPRISRAQSMDVLSSQTNLAGYRAVIEGMNILSRAMPMMMTAAGSVRPAKVVVLGAGVAGLQAIATAKRMGARVFAFDVRAATKEQVESLGATFIEVDQHENTNAETSGGYAKEVSDEYKKRQQDKIAQTLRDADLVITTALIPGKPAPVLITKEIVEEMRPGAVIVDMAVEAGGNCPLTKIDKVETHQNVILVGYPNLPSRVASDASSLYSNNLYNFFQLLWNKKTQTLEPNWEDEIISSTCVSGKKKQKNKKEEDKA